jgi:hypothetical protein
MYKTEQQLVRKFTISLRRLGLPSDVRISKEFDAGNGVADIVLYKKAEISRHSARLVRLVPPRLLILFGERLLPEAFTIEQLSSKSGFTQESVRRLIGQLCRQGLAEAVSNDEYSLVEALACPMETVVSIEAKLSDWRRALRQAYRYKEYSHQSWVLLDGARAAAAIKDLAQFKKWNVGLASINNEGEIFLLHEPQTELPTSKARFWSACSALTNLK